MARWPALRGPASGALNALARFIVKSNSIPVGEPFLAPGARFDSVVPGASLGDWTLAAILEELERTERFSSFFAGASGRSRLESIRELGYGSAEMDRRLQLLRKRFGG